MRSFIITVSLVAMATLTLLAPTTNAQEDYVPAQSKSGAPGGFVDALDSLRTLAVGPYPSLATLNISPNISSNGLDKRGYYCDPGYGLCSNEKSCCKDNVELCAPSGGCCPKNLKWECGGKYCCPFDSCLANGHCGCNDNLYRCINSCCKYGCKDGGECMCNPNFPVDCGGGSCCPAGYACIGGGMCMRESRTASGSVSSAAPTSTGNSGGGPAPGSTKTPNSDGQNSAGTALSMHVSAIIFAACAIAAVSFAF
ncbi:hypothetical protein BX616_009224 [Lobosporangium transversale]|uniref:Uncharacterized protein n=1 Tax=Lobosporangium transversale TaxID=64571 RepID=A0A1Y2H3S9_9FUNG|nr:hypothetical protein BCR41DRAFT_382624 [Lobosporangium transversale]KAF9913969.1 hypothetical protein BX616_009224 [Lobosporangium transversale]ORZ28641.1 hypothetical protein BCR41DRAFT_382624 [Lobosporangium transversale]|eukprot:XP_021886314.1 hypothetical protein BCR41DRAFT_382624 [Lobosporangium transversale]